MASSETSRRGVGDESDASARNPRVRFPLSSSNKSKHSQCGNAEGWGEAPGEPKGAGQALPRLASPLPVVIPRTRPVTVLSSFPRVEAARRHVEAELPGRQDPDCSTGAVCVTTSARYATARYPSFKRMTLGGSRSGILHRNEPKKEGKGAASSDSRC